MHGGFDEGNTLQVATNKLVASADTGLDQASRTPARAPKFTHDPMELLHHSVSALHP
jgi:hypothetical protein